MATSYTAILKLAMPATGELSGTWGTVVNDNVTQMVEEAVTGRASISTWTANVHTLTEANGTTSESRCVMLDLSGTLTATGTVVIPASFTKMYIVRNGTTGGYAVNVGMATGTTVTVPNGATVVVYVDGTNAKSVSASITSGYEVNLTATADTTVTLPTTGTLATLAGAETLTNKTLTNCTFPTLNQNTTGTAAGLSATLVVASGGTGASNAADARTNLGLGTAATLNVGTAANNVVQLNASAQLPAIDGSLLTGLAAFPSGTLMLFQQTAAPTGWTKQTTHNDKALRVVSGTASSGGTSAFTTVFTNQTPTINTSGLSAGATTLSTTQIPSHNHFTTFAIGYDAFSNGLTSNVGSGGTTNINTSSTGGGGSHTHSISGSATASAITLNVQYVDLIIASKN